MKACKFEKDISAWLDNALPEDKTRHLLDHIERCPVCQKTLEQYTTANQLISNLQAIDPSPDFDKKFWKEIDAMEKNAFSFKNIFNFLSGSRKMQMAYAFTIVLVVSTLIFKKDLFNPGEDDIMMARNLELLQEYEMIDNLDLFVNWDTVTKIKEET